ncbi:MAG: hypothetical protein AAB425_13140, partial [Bdellovibrionota bacterium]
DRDAAFAAAGLSGQIPNEWDQLDRDLLYLRARSEPLSNLKVRYPALDSSILQKLKAAVAQAVEK